MSEVFEGAIGIDLGTTYSCVAVFLHDHVEVIANDQGNRTTPSCVAFSGDEVLVGDSAKNLAARGMPGVIYDAKRLIGHHFSDKGVQEDKVHWPFSVVPGEQDKIEIQVDFRGETLRLAPEEISARVLAYLKECAEKYLGKQVKKAVVTVPAYFNDAQRERTKAAATIAGLDVLRIINEPTAAALCYGLGVQDTAQGSTDAAPLQVLVFDLGGGTFDVSIITVDGGTFAVRATAGDTHLGGQDIDNNLLQYIVADCQTRHGVDLNAQPRHLARARAACERVKRVLSHTTAEELVLDGVLPGGEDYVLTMSRAKLEELNVGVFERCMSVVKTALRDAKASAQEMDAVVLVGGSSRIPKVQALLGELFPGRRLSNAVHPDEAVAVGAAVQASILSTAPAQQSEKTASMVLMDVVPLSIGVEIDNGKFDVVIPRNTTIPYRATKEYSTVEDNQQDVDIAVFEGERTQTRHNHKLGEFSLEGITRAKKGEPTIVVTFSVDADGLLTITASEDLAKKTKTLVVQSSDRLSEAEVQKMLAQAERLARSKDMSKRGTNTADAASPPTSGSSPKGMSVAEATRVMNDALAELEAAVAAATGTASTDTLQACNKLLSHGREWMRRKLASYTEGPELSKKVRKVLKRVGRAIKLTQRTDQPPAAGLAPAPSNNVRSPLHGTKRARSESAESEDSESEPDDAAPLPASA